VAEGFSPGLDPWSLPVPDSGLAVDVRLEIELEKPLVWETAVADDAPPYRVALRVPSGPPSASPIPPPTLATPAWGETPAVVQAAPVRRRPSIRRLAPLVAVVAGLILIGVAVLPH
jgi:hypothetical protein